MLNLDMNLLRKALNEIEENSYQNLCILENATSNPIAVYRYGGFDVAKHRYNRDFNRNGDFIAFDRSERFLKFSFPININTPEDRAERRKNKTIEKPLVTLALRGKQHRPTVEAFVNGIKVPDQRVVMSIFEGGIDLYIPEIYFSGGDEISLLINKYTEQDRYVQFYIRDRMQQQFIFTNEDTRAVLKKENLKVFRNGHKLMETVDFNMRVEKNKLYLDLYTTLEEHETLEIISGSHCVHVVDFRSKADALIDFPDDLLPKLPISPDIVEVYKNGRRLFPHEIESLTARHLKIKDFERGARVTVRVHYNPNSSAITDRNAYIDDILRFFALKNRDQIRDILIYEKYDGIPDFIKNRVFPPRHIPIRNINPARDGMTYEEFVSWAIKEYIRINSQNMRILLKWFAGLADKIFSYSDKSRFERDDTSQEMGDFNLVKFDKKKVVYTMRINYDDFQLLVFINDVKVKHSEVMRFDYMGNTHVYLDSDRINDGDEVRFRIIRVRNRSFKKIFITDDASSQYFSINRKELGMIAKLSEIRVMRQKGEGFAYLTNGVDYYVSEDAEDPTKLKVFLASRRVGEIYCVYNTSYYEYRPSTFLEEEIETRSAVIFDDLDKASGIYIPRLSNYSTYLFIDGEMMIEGLDYFISGQDRHNEINVAKIVFRKIPKHLSEMELYSVEQEREQISAVESVDSTFGYIYLKDLPIPFSLEYLDLYVNGQKMKDEDINIISDRLIQIINKELKRPFYDVYITTNLGISMDDLEDFTDAYEEGKKDNPGFDDWLENDVIPDGGLDDVMNENQKPPPEPHPIDPEPRPPVIRLSPFLNYLALKLYSGDVPRLLNANLLTTIFRAIEFVELMTPEELARLEVVLDANKYGVFNEATLDSEQPRILDTDQVQMYELDFRRQVFNSPSFTQYDCSFIDGDIHFQGVYVNGVYYEGTSIAMYASETRKLTIKLQITETDEVSIVSSTTYKPRFHQVVEIVEKYLAENPEMDFNTLFENFDSLPIANRLYREELGIADANRGGEGKGNVVIFNANL